MMVGPPASASLGLALSREPRQPSRFKRICVFCGSSQGKKTTYRDAAVELAKQLLSRDIDLVCGGGSIGLMGLALAPEAVNRSSGHVAGNTRIKPLITCEIVGAETSRQVKLNAAEMHRRKAEMSRQSDAFIALPGGYGTLEMLFEVVTWAQLGIHRKPIGLLNVDGYYDSLLAFVSQAVADGFISPSASGIIVSAPTAQELMDNLEEYVPYYDRIASGLKWDVTKEEGDDDPKSITATGHVIPPQGRVLIGHPVEEEDPPGAARAKRSRTTLTVAK